MSSDKGSEEIEVDADAGAFPPIQETAQPDGDRQQYYEHNDREYYNPNQHQGGRRIQDGMTFTVHSTRYGPEFRPGRMGLTTEERTQVAQAVREGDRAVRQAEAMVAGINRSINTVPRVTSARAGAGNVTSFNNCSNLHIGSTNFITNNNSADGRSASRTRTKQRPVDHSIRRLQNEGRQVTQADLHKLSIHIGLDWKALGRSLEMMDGELEGYQHDYNVDGLREIGYQMVRGWRTSLGPQATVGTLVTALLSINRPDIAREVFLPHS